MAADDDTTVYNTHDRSARTRSPDISRLTSNMVAIASGTILITGVNGYIASWTTKAFLDAGFSVRGTVRDESKGKHLKEVLSSYGDRFEICVVPDISKVPPNSRLFSAASNLTTVFASYRRTRSTGQPRECPRSCTPARP